MSSDNNRDTEFLMDTLQVTEAVRPMTNFKSHSSFCLSSPGDAKRIEEEVWMKVGVPPVTCGNQNARGSLIHTMRGSDSMSALGSRCSMGGYEPLDRERTIRSSHHLRSREEVTSRKARWAIVLTAIALVLMSMLLVAITLHLAPIIDDLVRKENEELLRGRSLVTSGPEVKTSNQTLTSTIKPD